MNHIASLKQQIKSKDARISSLESSLEQFRFFLNSPKFTGTQCDGERKDWIATGDVLGWIQATNSAAITAGENVATS